jgi:hypothetical protein
VTTRIEDELVAGMREQTAGLLPPQDLVDRATRRNRRRRAGLATAATAIGLAGVLSVSMATLGRGAPERPSAAATQSAPAMLTVAEISNLAVAALATDDIEHVTATVSQNRRSYREEFWYDPTTRSARHHSVQPLPGDPVEDTWLIANAGHVVVTYVNRSTRTWWASERTMPDGKTASQFPYTPDELRAALSRGDSYRLVGNEKIGDLAVLHLRDERSEGGSDDLWVDAATYRAVRRVIVKGSGERAIRVQLDFDWQPRTDKNLAPLTVAVPDGFRQIDPSGS